MRQWTSTTFNCEVGLCRKCLNKLRKDTDRDSIKFPAFEIASDSQAIYDMDGRCAEFARHIDNLARKNLARKILAGKKPLTHQWRAIAMDRIHVGTPGCIGSRVKSLAPNHIVRGLET